METAVRTQEFIPVSVQTSNTKKPKRLSKAGQWMRNNPNGIFEYVDWRAVNK